MIAHRTPCQCFRIWRIATTGYSLQILYDFWWSEYMQFKTLTNHACSQRASIVPASGRPLQESSRRAEVEHSKTPSNFCQLDSSNHDGMLTRSETYPENRMPMSVRIVAYHVVNKCSLRELQCWEWVWPYSTALFTIRNASYLRFSSLSIIIRSKSGSDKETWWLLQWASLRTYEGAQRSAGRHKSCQTWKIAYQL